MDEHGVELAAHETKIALLTKKCISTMQDFDVGNATIHCEELKGDLW